VLACVAGLGFATCDPSGPLLDVARASGADRPNIGVVMADAMRTDELRYMPAVRRLVADQGLTFRNSFSPFPLCCPARASFLTGRYAHNHQVLSHTAPYGFGAFDDSRTLATALRRGGYRKAFVGKYLNGYGKQRSLVTGERSLRYVPGGWTDWYAAVEPPRGSGISGGTYNYLNTPFNINGRLDTSHRGEYQTNVLGRFSRELVTGYSRIDQPFFLYLSSVAPHFGGPREADDPAPVRRLDGRWSRFRTPGRPAWVRGRFDDRITRAPGLPSDGGPSEADVSDKPAPFSALPEINAKERRALTELARQRAEAVHVLDREVSGLVRTLKATGEWRDTVLMVTSDNGYFLGEHRMRTGKIRAHEPSLRVPFVIRGPGIPRGERFDPVTTPGLTATIAELAGVRPPLPGDGVSVMPAFGADQGWSIPVLTEGLLDGGASGAAGASRRAAGFTDPRNTIGLRTARYKFTRYANGGTELYDLDRDPNELETRAEDPAYAGLRGRLAELWYAYKDCAGAECLTPLPADLRHDPGEVRTSTNLHSRGVRARHGYWR
jgi:arylsulfatase A-like enzyme